MADQLEYAEEKHYEDDCWRCGGRGWIVRCVDDMCHGAGSCLHGDGNVQCPECERPTWDWDYSEMVVW